MNADDRLTPRDAYAARFAFLERFLRSRDFTELGGFLGELALLSDGGSAEPVHWRRWCGVIQRADPAGDGLGEEAGFLTVTAFLEEFNEIPRFPEIEDLIEVMRRSGPDRPDPLGYWNSWLASVREARRGDVDLDLLRDG